MAMTAKVLTTLAAAAAAFAATDPAHAAAPGCYTNWQGKPEINVKAQFGTDDAAVRAAIAVAQDGRCGVYFDANTTFHTSDLITLDGISAYGGGPSTVISEDNPDRSAIILAGASPSLVNLTVASPNATARSGDWEANGVWIQFADGFIVDHVIVDGAAGAGIFNEGGTHGKITSNTVEDTRADGIHTMGGAGWDVVYGNTVANTGDDMISIVSYHHWATNHDIDEGYNTLRGNTWGRGMSIVGGTNIQLHDNTIAHTHAAAIYVEAEGNANPDIASWPVEHVTIDRNTVRGPDEGLIHDVNILVGTYRSTVTTTDVRGSGNDLDRSRPGLRTEGGVADISVGWFYGD
jgi:hypothetical protein